MIKKLHSTQRMSKTVIYNQTIYLCGQVGNAEDDIKAQTKTCLDKIQTLLAEVGSDKSKLLSMTVWIKSMSDFAAMNEVYDQWFEGMQPPARACGESALARPELLVEMIAIAAE